MDELRPGTYTMGPPGGTVAVRTLREGLAARVGHDLVMELTRWRATLTVPESGSERPHLSATLETRSLTVREGKGGAMPLSEKDIADITRNAFDKVLQVDAHPEIAFESTLVGPVEAGRIAVAGTLTLVGVARPVRFSGQVTEVDGQTRITATIPIVQSEWGIKPFRAFMGALKVRDEVDVHLDIGVPAAPDSTDGAASPPAAQ